MASTRRPWRRGQRRGPHRRRQVGDGQDREHQSGVAARSARGPAAGTAPAPGRTTPGRTRTRAGAARPAVNARDLNSAGASIGAPPPAASRRCWTANAASSSGAAASDSQVHSGQPCAWPSTSGSTIAVTAAVTSVVPATSIRPPVAERDSGTTRAHQRQRAEADREVDQEDRAPLQSGRIGRRAARRRAAGRRPRPDPSPCRRPTAPAAGPGRRTARRSAPARWATAAPPPTPCTSRRDHERGRARRDAAARRRQREQRQPEREQRRRP